MDSVYKEYYDWLSKRELEKKFVTRFEDKYFPHIQRGFLETWKEDGFLKAFKQSFDEFKNNEKYLTILDEKTGNILPYQKWVGFTQFRKGGLVPTQNASKEFKRTKIFEMINHQKEKYSWEFIFLAANQDAIAAGTSIGISFDKCANFDPTQKGAHDSFAKMAYATSSYRTLGVIDSSWKDVTLSDE